MVSLINTHREPIADLCRRFGVRRLEIFGSAADGRFNPTTSDLDFLVTFDRIAAMGPADQYFGLLEGGLRRFCIGRLTLSSRKQSGTPTFWKA